MYKAKLVNSSNSYITTWKDTKEYPFSGGVELVIPEDLKEYLEPMKDIKGNSLFAFEPIKEIVDTKNIVEGSNDPETLNKTKKVVKKAVE